MIKIDRGCFGDIITMNGSNVEVIDGQDWVLSTKGRVQIEEFVQTYIDHLDEYYLKEIFTNLVEQLGQVTDRYDCEQCGDYNYMIKFDTER